MTIQKTSPYGSRKHFAILLGIIFVAIALRVYTFAGYVGLDDAEYARFAYQMAQGRFSIGAYEGPPVFPLRVGIIFPTSILFHYFGVSEWSMVLYPFFISIMSVLLMFYCARYFFGYRAGLIAAFIFAILPIDLINATRLLPDLPAAFFASLGVVCILVMINSFAQHKYIPLYGGIIAGILFGLSWLTKENVAYLFPFCIALIVVTLKNDFRKNMMLWSGVAIGSLSILIIEMIVYQSMMGDWLFRFHEMEKNYQIKDGFFTEGSRWGWPKGGSYIRALLKRLFMTGPKTIFLNDLFLFTPLVALIGTLHALYWKDKAFLIPALWLITLVFMYNFASSSTSFYSPLPLLYRYLYPICFPAIIVTAGFLHKLLFNKEGDIISKTVKKEQVFWGTALVIFLCVIGGYQTLNLIRYAKVSQGWAPEGRIISNILKPSDRIYTDILNIKSLEFYWHYPKKMETVDFEGLKSIDEIPTGSFVLIHPRAVDWLEINSGMWLTKDLVYNKPDFFKNVPSSWKTVWQNGNAILYRVE